LPPPNNALPAINDFSW